MPAPEVVFAIFITGIGTGWVGRGLWARYRVARALADKRLKLPRAY